MPDFYWEFRLGGLVAGVDEAGRGPLAGPVIAAAVIFPDCRLPKGLEGLDDSKKIPAAKREKFARILVHEAAHGRIGLGVGAASAFEIDRINILQASFLAMRRALDSLRMGSGRAVAGTALIDGNRAPPGLTIPSQTVVGGDAACFSIAAASVMAKTVRDRIMGQLAVRYVHYGWERNAGYPTRDHLAALERHGATCHHRRTFGPVSRIQGC